MEEVDKKIIEIIAKELKVDPSLITLDTNIMEEYDSDSLKLVEILFSIEDEFDIEVENRTAEHIRTVGDIIREIKIIIEKYNSWHTLIKCVNIKIWQSTALTSEN